MRDFLCEYRYKCMRLSRYPSEFLYRNYQDAAFGVNKVVVRKIAIRPLGRVIMPGKSVCRTLGSASRNCIKFNRTCFSRVRRNTTGN